MDCRADLYYEEGCLEECHGYPVRMKYGVYVVCISGRGEVSTGIEEYVLQEGARLLFLAGAVLQIVNASADFHVRAFYFSEELFHAAAVPLDPRYVHYIHEFPYRMDSPESSEWKTAIMWMDIVCMECRYRGTLYRDISQKDMLQGFLIAICRDIPLGVECGGAPRKELIFHRFVSLVRRHCRERHDACFYAGELCISLRYLRSVTVELSQGRTPKQLIDDQLVAEIKALLYDSDLTVTQIADRLNFADQSYLSRFFRRKTGFSPYRYRMLCRKG